MDPNVYHSLFLPNVGHFKNIGDIINITSATSWFSYSYFSHFCLLSGQSLIP